MGFITTYQANTSIIEIETAFLLLSVFSYGIGKLRE
jgi:hypothetical protein